MRWKVIDLSPLKQKAARIFLTKGFKKFLWNIYWTCQQVCFCFCFLYWKVLNRVHLMLQKQLPEVFYKKVLIKILQNSKENTCDKVSFLIKLHAAPTILLKKRLWYWCFPVNFAKFLRTPCSHNTFGRLLLILLVLYLSTTISIQFWIIILQRMTVLSSVFGDDNEFQD